MPASQLTDQELEQLLLAVVSTDGADVVDSIIGSCHEFDTTYGSLMPYEKYFCKKLTYRDFDLHIPRFVVEGSRIEEADIQFRRRSKFPAPYINRNRKLVKRIQSILDSLYEGEQIRKHKEVDGLGCQIHYKAALGHYTSENILEWAGECTLIDEPHSSGQTDEDLTDIRNDFVIIRFNKKKHNQQLD